MKADENELNKTVKEDGEMFQKMFDRVAAAYAICELVFDKDEIPVDYRFLKINPAFEKHTGLKSNATLGKTACEIYPDFESTLIDKYSDVVLHKKNIQFIDYNYSTNKYFNVSAFHVSGNKFVMTLEDITNEKRLEEELKNSEKDYKQVFNSMSEMFLVIELIYDEDSHVVDYCYLQVNPAFEKFVNKDRSELVGKRSKSIFEIVEDHRLKMFERIDKSGVTETEENYGAEFDKYYKIKAWKVKDGKIGISFSDITNRYKAEKTIKTQNEFQDSLLKSFSDVIFIYDLEQKKNIYVNKAIGTVLGYSLVEIQNMNNIVEVLMHPDDYKDYCENILPRFLKATDEDLIEHEYRMKSKQGSWVWLYSRESIYKRNREGIPVQIFGLTIDITEKKQLENKLEKTRVLLKETNELGKIGGWELDLVTMKTYMTEELYKIHELPLNTQINVEDGIKYYPRKNRPIIKELVNKAIETGEPYSFESPFITAKGKEIYVETQGKVHLENGKAVRLYGTVQDITTSKKLEGETKKLSTAIEQSPNSIIITGLQGHIEYTNPKFTKITGYSAEEVLGERYNFLDSGVVPRSYYSEIAKVILAGEIWTGEIENKTKDGKLFWEETSITPIKNEEGNVINYLAIKKDITELKETSLILKKQNTELLQLGDELYLKNKLLVETKNKFKNLFEKSPVSIWEQDFSEVLALLNQKKTEVKDLITYIHENPLFVKKCVSEIKILNVNQKTLDLIGVENSEELVAHIRKTNTDKSHAALKDELISIVTGNKDFFGETEFIKTDGSILNVIIRSTMLNEYGDNIASIVDITARKQAEKELEKAKDKAEESDMLKTEFINNMSHEIRTPMNGILGFSDLLGSPNLTDQKRNNFIRIIQSSGHQLLHIIDDILEISQLGTKQVKVKETEVCLNDVLMELFSIFESSARENALSLYFKKQLTDKQSTILTDKLKLNKVLSNLLENALKYTNEGFVEFGYELKNKEVEIFVKDTGVGINKENHSKIFERFAQEEKNLSHKTGGLGLGLSIAKENTELLGGKIRLESEKGKGSTFFITIPYKQVYISDNAEESQQTSTYAILIAEDEEVNFLYLEALINDITNLECNIIHAKNGYEAIEICKTNTDIDLVLMDLKMPVLSGCKATMQIKKIAASLPVIAQTAYVTENEQNEALNAGCDDIISKPITSEAIVNILDRYLIKK